MDEALFIAELTRLSLATRGNVDRATLLVYYDALGGQTTAKEWPAFIRQSVQSGKYEFFPTVAKILEGLREFRGERPLLAEATEAYERVLRSGTYSPEGGTSWDYRSVVTRCGRAAGEAFLAAGGHHAFATTYHETERREKFITAYQDAVKAEPSAKLLTPGKRPELADESTDRGLTHEEALAIMGRIPKRGVK